MAPDIHAAGELLRESRLPALEARALLARQLGVAREQLIAWPGREVVAADGEHFFRLAERRRTGEPLAYLLGEKEFYGRPYSVSPAVLIPRPESERLVEVALETVPADEARVLDLGTGSGCIAITLALERPQWQIVATDLSTRTIETARDNAMRHGLRNVEFHQGDWFSALSDGRLFDLIVSNPPYVAAGDPHLHALRFEPLLALVAPGDAGLACLRTIISKAAAFLVPGGRLAVEHGHDQGAAVRELFALHGWRSTETRVDLAGLERVTTGLAGV